MELNGRVALVTGGGSGMGRATARRLVEEGMQVCLVDIDGDAAKEVADPIGAFAVTADVSDPDQVDAAFAACIDRFGTVDLAYLNAGIRGYGPDVGELTMDWYKKVVGVNQDHVVFGARAAVRAMRSRPDGRTGGVIVATSSIGGINPVDFDFLYALTKFAVVGFMRSIAPGLAQEGIAAHTMCPGATDSNFMMQANRERMAAAGIPLIDPTQIADAVVHAATSPMEMSGTCWIVHPDEAPIAWEFHDVPGPHSVLDRH